MNCRENWNRLDILAVLLILAIGGCLPTLCVAQQTIAGTVFDKTEKPLVGIEVWGDSLSHPIDSAHPHVYAVTDSSGKFDIVSPGATLRINNWDLRPSRVVVGPETHNVEFVVESATSQAVRVPWCEDSRFAKRASRKRSTGMFWGFLLPRGAKVRRQSDDDYVIETIHFGDVGDHLQLAYGPIYGGYEAPSEWLVEAQEFTERAIVGPDESRGGRLWNFENRAAISLVRTWH